MTQTKERQYLFRTAKVMRRMQAKVDRLDGDLVVRDIAARRQEALLGWEFAKHVDRIEAALKTLRANTSIDQWCKQNCECDISTMRRRKRLYKHWNEYEVKRREIGACGQTGLLFALSLVSEDSSATAMDRQGLPVRSSVGTTQRTTASTSRSDMSRCQFITGDALTELRKMRPQSVNAMATSPPYWPAKRAYAGRGIGFEKTLDGYITSLVSTFHEARRVLRNDGILWVCIDDSYKDGNLLFIPSRLGMAMQDDGWVCRAEIVWQKRGGGRPEPVSNRPTKDHEKVLMFVKHRNGYHYDSDPIRVPLVGPYSTPRRKKPGLNRHDYDRTEKVWSNPMGRNSGSVWEITPSSYQGTHAATMPAELVRRLLLVSCPERGTVLDMFGGAGTTALVALQLGHRAISIDINPAYTKEARERISFEMRDEFVEPDALAAD